MRSIAGIGLAVAALSLAGCGGNGSGDTGDETGRTSEAETPVEAGDVAQPAAEPSMAEAEELAAVAATSAAQPPAAFQQCLSCHSVEPGQNRIGPSLAGVFGHHAASVPGFNYSPALKGSGITWDRASLDSWITAPMKMVPGTRMVIGVPNPEAREAIIDYLETLN